MVESRILERRVLEGGALEGRVDGVGGWAKDFRRHPMLLVLRSIWRGRILRSVRRLLELIEGGLLARGILLICRLWWRSRVEGILVSRGYRPPSITHKLVIVDLPLLQIILRSIALHLRYGRCTAAQRVELAQEDVISRDVTKSSAGEENQEAGSNRG